MFQGKPLHLQGECDLRIGSEPQGRVPGRPKQVAKTNSAKTKYWEKTNCPAMTNCADELREDELAGKDELRSEDELRRRIARRRLSGAGELCSEDELGRQVLRRRITQRRRTPRRRISRQKRIAKTSLPGEDKIVLEWGLPAKMSCQAKTAWEDEPQT